jgi:hypothetical protein
VEDCTQMLHLSKLENLKDLAKLANNFVKYGNSLHMKSRSHVININRHVNL